MWEFQSWIEDCIRNGKAKGLSLGTMIIVLMQVLNGLILEYILGRSK